MAISKTDPPTASPNFPSERLDSWKEIAAYLKRDERTVRRWEKEGLPVRRKVHKKQASVYAYREEIDAWWKSDRICVEPVNQRGTRRRRLLWLLVGFVVAGVLVVVAVRAGDLLRVRWARNQALPEVAHLLDQDKLDQAFRLTREVQRYIPNDPMLTHLLRSFTIPVSIETAPAGADVSVKTYSAANEDWVHLGRSPLENVRVPWDHLRWKISKQGFETVEAASWGHRNERLNFTLDVVGARPRDMVRVTGGTFQFRSASPVQLESYWLDRYEVTNHQFKAFMERDGYQNRANWKEPFVKNGRVLSWEEAAAEFRDSTGRVGPSTWELGSFADGQADFPVGGVSWYEAAAYCESVGKTLPTIYHWYKAAGLGIDSDILQFSNFNGKAPVGTGTLQGLGPFGTYDMAGNVKEWAWNEVGAKHYVLGGAWNEPSYTFATEDAALPFSRSPTLGFRCAKYVSPPPAVLTQSIYTLSRDYKRESRSLIQSTASIRVCIPMTIVSWTHAWNRRTIHPSTGGRKESVLRQHTAMSESPHICSCPRAPAPHTRRSFISRAFPVSSKDRAKA